MIWFLILPPFQSKISEILKDYNAHYYLIHCTYTIVTKILDLEHNEVDGIGLSSETFSQV